MLERLKISGIRSFPPNAQAVIDFDPKLTLITGPNGAGKTTIIESLKAVTCGDFPPGTDKGRSFLHDPRLTERPEVHASIKLRFTDSKNQSVCCTRIFKLSRKTGNKLELRKIENILGEFDSSGSLSERSLKLGEIDSIVPERLGIAAPILQHVTFCHQDESLWPFGESALLKTVLDQVFATDTFSKAVDSQKKFLKKEATQSNAKKQTLNWALDSLERNKASEKKHRALVRELKQLREKRQMLEARVSYAASKKSEYSHFQRLDQERTQLRTESEKLQQFLQQYPDIDELDGSSEEAQLQQIETTLAELDARKAQLTDELQVIQAKERGMSERISALTALKQYTDSLAAQAEAQLHQNTVTAESLVNKQQELVELTNNFTAFQREAEKEQRERETECSSLEFDLRLIQRKQEELQREAEELHDSADIVTQLRQEVADLESSVEGLEEQLSVVTAKLGSSQSDVLTWELQILLDCFGQIATQEPHVKELPISHYSRYLASVIGMLKETIAQESSAGATEATAHWKELKQRFQRHQINVEFIKKYFSVFDSVKEKLLSEVTAEPTALVHNLLMQKQTLEDKLSQLKTELQTKLGQLQVAQAELARSQDKETQARGLTEDILSRQAKIRCLREEFSLFEQVSANYQDEQATHIRECEAAVSHYEQVLEAVQKYEELQVTSQKHAEDISQLCQEHTSIQHNLTSHQTQLNQVQTELDSLSQQKHAFAGIHHKRALKAELNQRRQHFAQVQLRLEVLNEELRGYSSEEFHNAHTEEMQLIQLLGETVGALTSKEQELSSCSSDGQLNAKVTALFVESEVLELALKEFKLMQSVLEASIVEYHKVKIDEINTVLKNLWQQMYKGKDIESIYLRTDPVMRGGEQRFNYRICFKGLTTELDMRGRCSAGQRMIASVAIRIALAEAFSTGRIIIVLDEPTTNMDADNSEGLSAALAEVAMSHPKLQLIIITHDEHFSHQVLRNTPSALYFTVQKVRGLSQVNRVRKGY